MWLIVTYFFCRRLSHPIIIYSPINITIGKGKIDGITAIDKCLIFRIASRELIDAMEKEEDETAHGTLEEDSTLMTLMKKDKNFQWQKNAQDC